MKMPVSAASVEYDSPLQEVYIAHTCMAHAYILHLSVTAMELMILPSIIGHVARPRQHGSMHGCA